MKLCLLLMFGGLCRGDILNLGYLPPPGAKVSGGSDGALDVPLETPFKTPQSSFQSNPIEGSLTGNSGHEDKKTYGTTPPSGFHEEDNFTAGTQPESVNVPTTTTSFAFTQTTTFSPLNKIQCDEPHCISENKFPTSSFPISQIPSDISQKISNAHTPQSNAYKPIPQFQSPEIGSATPGLVSNTYGTTFQPNHDSSQTQDTVDTQSPSAQSFPPGSIIGSFQPHLNESYRPGGIAPLTQLPSGKENYVNNFPGTSALPQFTRAQSVLPAGITVVPMSSFKRPGFGTQPSQYPGAQVTDRNFLTSESDNIPAKDGQPGDKYVVPGSFPSITSPKIFSQQPIIPPGFPNVPTSGAITVIPTGSSEGLTSDGQIQYPGSHPVVPSFTVGAPGSYYNKPHQSGPIQPVQPFDLSKARFDSNATILKYDNIITPEGYFSYSFDTSNGIHADESGDASDGVKAEGAYSYTGDDGQFYSITYTADENGYQPKGDHLPTPPPIPEAIQRVIEQSTRDKAAGIIPDQGLYNEDKYGYKKYNGKLGQDSPFETQTSGEIGSNNINTRRPIAPDRRPSNSGISPNLAQPSVSRTPGDMLFGQTTLRPTYSNKYNIPDQGIDKKIGSHKPTKYLPEYSSSPTIYGKPFDYNNRGTPTATGKNYGEIRPNIPQGEPTLAVGSRDQTEQGEPNLTESQTTSALNLFRGTGTPSKNVRPIQQGYDQFGQPISNNNYPSKPNIPIKKGQHYGSSGRPIDEKNASIVLNEGKFPERIFYKKNDQFIQRNGPSGIRDGMPSEQGNDGRIPGQGGTDGPTSEDFIVPVEVQYDDAVYRGNSQIIPISSPGVTTLRPISYFTDNGSRIRSENEFVKGEDSTNKPIANQPQEFYQKNAAVNNRFPPLSERQGAIEKVNAGMAMTIFVPSPSNNFPQRQQTNAIVRPYDRTITRPISGYKYEVPSQRFDMDVSERYQPEKKITSFGQVPRVSETLEDGESESTAAPSSTIALEDVYQSTPEVTNSGIIVRPTKKPGRPSPGSAELFNITPDTLDTTVTATDSPMGQRFSATSPRPKPVTTNRGNIRYEPVSSEVPTIIPDGSKRVTNIPEFSFSASRHTSSTEPDPSEDVQGEFVTSMPEYNHFSYKQKIPQPGTTAEDVGIYGTAPTQTYGEDFVQAQPSTPKTFQVPKTKPQHTYPESHFMSSTLVPEDPASSYLGDTQDYKHSSTIKPFGSQFGQQRPSRPRVSGYPTTQRPGFTSTETTQYTTSRPGYIEKQSTFTPTTNEQIYPGEDQRFEQKKGDGRYHQSVVMPHELIRGESEHEPGKFVQKIPGELELDQTLDQFRSDQPTPGKFGLNKKPPNFGSDKQILGPSETSQQIPGKIGSEQHKPGNVGLNKQKPEKFESEQQRTMQFGLDQQRPGQFGSDQQRTEQFRHDQQIPGKFGLEQQKPIKSELDQYKLVQFGSDQQRRGQFGFGQQTPGKIGSDQQRPGEFRLDQQGPGQFGSDEQLTGQFKHEHQKPGKFGLEQQESDKFRFDQQGPGQYELDQQRPGKLGSEQQRPVQFGLDKQRPGQFGYDQQGSGQIELDQQRPGTFGSEQQRPAQFGLDKQRPGQFGSDQPIRGQFGFGQHKPGKIGSEQQRPGEFGLDQHGPGQYELDQQRPGKFGSEQQRPGQFGLDKQRPGQFGSDQQISGQFGSDQQIPGEYGLEQQRPVKFGSEQQRPGQFGLDKQRPGQFGSDQQISGQFGSDQQIPGEYGLEQQRPVKFGSEQPIPGQFGLDKQRPGQFGSDQQEPGQFGSRVTIFPKIKGETFSPSRKPPSYDAETGYHY